jgi:hypothetical protein
MFCKGWVVQAVELKLETHHPVIEPVSTRAGNGNLGRGDKPANGAFCQAETARRDTCGCESPHSGALNAKGLMKVSTRGLGGGGCSPAKPVSNTEIPCYRESAGNFADFLHFKRLSALRKPKHCNGFLSVFPAQNSRESTPLQQRKPWSRAGKLANPDQTRFEPC